MVINISIPDNNYPNSRCYRLSGERYKRIEGFPGLYVDRYDYIGHVVVRADYGEASPPPPPDMYETPEGAYMLNIGAFNSISWDNHFIIDQNHDYKSVSTSDNKFINTGPFRQRQCRIRRKGSVIIQNDVWIGQQCTIYGGVTIHNGAVVAGNSVVTKDVPPYCIVAGVPARIIKRRFPEEIIEKMLQIQWWYWSEEKLEENAEWFEKSPEEFVDRFYNPNEKKPAPIDIPSYGQTYLFFPDFDEPYGLWKYVILSFCDTFSQREDCGLVLFVNNSDKVQDDLQKIEKLTENIDAKCGVYVYAGSIDEEDAAFAQVDYYITSRSLQTVKRTCLADKYRVQTISGADIPIF